MCGVVICHHDFRICFKLFFVGFYCVLFCVVDFDFDCDLLKLIRRRRKTK